MFSYFYSFFKKSDDLQPSRETTGISVEEHTLTKNVLDDLANHYSAYLDSHITDASVFTPYQNIEKNGDIAHRLSGCKVSDIIKQAYPILETDASGQSIDNRDQAVIDAVTNFVDDKEKNKDSQTKEEAMILKGIDILSAVNSAKNMLNKVIQCKSDPSVDQECLKMLEGTARTYKNMAFDLLASVESSDFLKQSALDREVATFVKVDDPTQSDDPVPPQKFTM